MYTNPRRDLAMRRNSKQPFHAGPYQGTPFIIQITLANPRHYQLLDPFRSISGRWLTHGELIAPVNSVYDRHGPTSGSDSYERCERNTRKRRKRITKLSRETVKKKKKKKKGSVRYLLSRCWSKRSTKAWSEDRTISWRVAQ